MRDLAVRRPVPRAEAGLGGLRERPDAEMPGSRHALAEIIVVTGVRLERQPQGVHEQLAALGRLRRDDRDARNEQDVHLGLR
jgi:hypothetical protein